MTRFRKFKLHCAMNTILNFLIFFCALAYGCADSNCKPSITKVRGQPVCTEELIFEENFDSLNKTLWKSEVTLWGGGNKEFEWYVDDDENRFVRDGKLYIRPTLTVDKIGAHNLENGYISLAGCTDADEQNCHQQATPDRIIKPIRSARLNTAGSFSFKFGRVEVIARIPTGDWLWPAIWLLPTKWKYGEWPKSGEIDLVEARGNRKYIDGDGTQTGVEQVTSTLHFGLSKEQDKYLTSTYSINNPNGYNNDFHKYEMLWNDQGIKFFVDGIEFGFVPVDQGFWHRGHFSEGDNIWKNGSKMTPFDEEFHFILNLAVGGESFFPDTGNQNGRKPWANRNMEEAPTLFWRGRSQWLEGWNLQENNGEHASLVIDSIKVWAI